MTWVFHRACEAFNRYRELWDEINKKQGNHILLDSVFVEELIHCFASDEILLAVSTDQNNRGVALLKRDRYGFWQTFQPAQAPIGLILLANKHDILKQVQTLIDHLPGYALGVGVLRQDPDFTPFDKINHSLTTEVINDIKTSRIAISGNFEEYWTGRGRYYVADLRRQIRRLTEQGIHFKLVVERDPRRVAKCIQEYGRLESTGWKGKEGTAVTANNKQGLFYSRILEHFCNQGEGVIYKLVFNDKTVAIDLCLERNDMIVVLKIAYDEALKGFSPGKLLHQEMLRALFDGGNIRVLEWYGRVHEWQMKLSNDIRTMCHINFYRYSWVALVRRYLKSASQWLNNSSRNISKTISNIVNNEDSV